MVMGEAAAAALGSAGAACASPGRNMSLVSPGED